MWHRPLKDGIHFPKVCVVCSPHRAVLRLLELHLDVAQLLFVLEPLGSMLAMKLGVGFKEVVWGGVRLCGGQNISRPRHKQ